MRDGSYTAYAMDTAGEHDSAKAFFRWVGVSLQKYRYKIPLISKKIESGNGLGKDEVLHTRFTVEGEETNEDAQWGNFQIDGYGTWLWAVVEHVNRICDDSLIDELSESIEITLEYLRLVWNIPSYDCWEEYPDFLHPYSLSCVISGLTAISPFLQSTKKRQVLNLTHQIKDYLLSNGIQNGKFCKLIDPINQENHLRYEADASLIGLSLPNNIIPPNHPAMRETIRSIEQDLLRPGGGVYRYRSDVFYGGGEWLLLAAWLGWYYASLGKIDQAEALCAWIESQAGLDGTLPEQVSDHLLAPDQFAAWVEKWGPVAKPLTWSHAMYVILVNAIEDAKQK